MILPWLQPQPHPFPSSPFLAYEICMENRCPCSPTPRPPQGQPPPPAPRGFPDPSANGCLAWLFNIDEGGGPGQPMGSWGCVCVSPYIYIGLGQLRCVCACECVCTRACVSVGGPSTWPSPPQPPGLYIPNMCTPLICPGACTATPRCPGEV